LNTLRYDSAVSFTRGRQHHPDINMKNEITSLAVSLGLIGSAAYLLSRVHPTVTAESLIGYGVILGLLALAALEYRINWKSLIGR
jgi:hypothetical protein